MKLRVSIVQSDLKWENIEENITHHTRLISDTKESDLIILPEMFTTGFTLNAAQCAEKMDGLAVHWLLETAKNKSCAITGSIIINEGNNYYNRMIWANPDGNIFFYDKRHLFRMAGEHKHYSPGTKKTIVEYKGWKIALFVCYDLRFPVWSRNTEKYDLAIYVANWPVRRTSAWRTLLAARAIENQCFVAGVNRCGTDGMNLNYQGDSRIINPFGDILVECEAYQESIMHADINKNEVEEFRTSFPTYLDADKFNIL
jgi:omega-amidase